MTLKLMATLSTRKTQTSLISFTRPRLTSDLYKIPLLPARSDERLRVFVLGGSAAMGFPHKNHGVDRLLAAQLRALFPHKDVEVVNTAMTSVNSHVVYQVAQTLPPGSADVAVVLMGNNEVVGPYGPGTFNQNFLSSLSAYSWLAGPEADTPLAAVG
jgi:hypothetical protein